jgi:hypothetical protein
MPPVEQCECADLSLAVERKERVGVALEVRIAVAGANPQRGLP